MEGAYNKVLAARDDMPDPAYAYFMQRLLTTVRCGPVRRAGSARLPRVCPEPAGHWPARGSPPCRARCSTDATACACRRDEIAGCSERAYGSLSVADARKLMLFASDDEATAFAEQVRCAHSGHQHIQALQYVFAWRMCQGAALCEAG